MGKKQKEDVPTVSTTPNRDIIQRLNFLYQASVYLQSISPPHTLAAISGSKEPKEVVPDEITRHDLKKKSKGKSRYKTKTSNDLARGYIHSMRLVAQKTTVKIDPSLKRSLCSFCNSTLIPGVSASVRVKSSAGHGHQMVYACLYCKAAKRIPAPLTPHGSIPISTASADDDTELQNVQGNSIPRQKLHRKPPTSRSLPLFARADAGHMIFRGNDQLSRNEAGHTPFV